ALWGAQDSDGQLLAPGLVYAYEPVAQKWTQYQIDSPPEFAFGFPVVTSSQAVLVWGGFAVAGQPAPYGHALDWASWSWSPLPIINQPSPRFHHSASWTGREM